MIKKEKKIRAKKKARLRPCHAHQAIGSMGGRGKCPRYIYYRPYPPKSLIVLIYFFEYFFEKPVSFYAFYSFILRKPVNLPRCLPYRYDLLRLRLSL